MGGGGRGGGLVVLGGSAPALIKTNEHPLWAGTGMLRLGWDTGTSRSVVIFNHLTTVRVTDTRLAEGIPRPTTRTHSSIHHRSPPSHPGSPPHPRGGGYGGQTRRRTPPGRPPRNGRAAKGGSGAVRPRAMMNGEGGPGGARPRFSFRRN